MNHDETHSRILFHTLNGSGLGHLSRQVALARALRTINPSTEILFASESLYGPSMAPEFPFIMLPSTGKLRTEAWSNRGSYRLASTIFAMVDSLLAAFNPGVVIHDTMIWPPLFEAAAKAKIKQAIVLRLRKDIESYLNEASSLARRCDLIIFPYDSHEVTSYLKGNFPNKCPPIAWIGRIARRPTSNPHSTRMRLNISDEASLILVTAGGGGFDGTQQFYQQVVKALEMISSHLSNYLVVLVLGPSYVSVPPTTHQINVQVWQNVAWMPDLIAASDLVICQAGYNTIAEVELAGVSAIVIPARRNFDDQFARAHDTVMRRTNVRIFNHLENTQELSDMIVDALHTRRLAEQQILEARSNNETFQEKELRRIVALGKVDRDPAEGNLSPLPTFIHHQ